MYIPAELRAPNAGFFSRAMFTSSEVAMIVEPYDTVT